MSRPLTDRQAFAVVFGIVFAVCAAPFVFVGLYEFDNVVTDGEHYGFTIGDSVSEVSSRIAAEHDAQGWTRAMIWGEGNDFHAVDVSDLTLHDIEHAETVRLQYGDSSLNRLRLHLENGVLVEMYRSRLLSERP